MSGFFAYFLRFFLILIGYACAALGASAFIHLLLVGLFELTSEEFAFISGGFFVSVPIVALFVSYFAFFPAMIAIAIAEVAVRRDWLFFAIAGGVVGVAAVYIRGLTLWTDEGLSQPMLAIGACAAGIAGGLCYWLVAGSSSGIRRDV